MSSTGLIFNAVIYRNAVVGAIKSDNMTINLGNITFIRDINDLLNVGELRRETTSNRIKIIRIIDISGSGILRIDSILPGLSWQYNTY